MRHSYYGKKLSRNTDERKRLFRSLARDLILHGQIKTTLAKAKAVQPFVEGLITTTKQHTDVSKRRLVAALYDRVAVNSLVDDSEVRFGKRLSGYTRIVRLGQRMGDGGDEVLLSFVDEKIIAETIKPVSQKLENNKTSVKEKQIEKPLTKRGRAKK